MSYAAGVGGAKASTLYPCGHMAYYDSGTAPPLICPICGMRHQNASMMAPASAGYVMTTTSDNTNLASTGQMIGSSQFTYEVSPAEWAEDRDYPELAWLDREISRYTKP